MSRPETDIEAGRKKLIETAERIIRERGAITFTITDLAAEAGMSQSNVYRFFENKDALAEAMAGEWFAELIAIIECVVEADLPAKEKLFLFFAQRLAVKKARFEEDPDLFRSYMELGNQHFEVIRGYIDLADHYMATILAEAMEEGYFTGLTLDRVIKLVNLMMQPFCNPKVMMQMTHMANEPHIASEESLHSIIDTIFTGLKARDTQSAKKPALHLAN